jgi:hypothetical protein
MERRQAARVLGGTGCRWLGFAGSVVLALGGVGGAGALSTRQTLLPLHGHPALGLFAAYFGLVLLIAAWWWLGRAEHSPRRLLITLALWAAPLVLAPPLFSRDIYSYLAQGAMVQAHMDVYVHGPDRLGGPLAADVPAVWQDTPAPYGPVFLGMTAVLVPAGLTGMRLIALAGVGLMIAFLPRLARRCGVDPAAALWLGALNPLVLLHLVGGAHNDALMLGLLGAGMVAALAGAGRRAPDGPDGGPQDGPETAADGGEARAGRAAVPDRFRTVRWPMAATVLVTLAALVKAPAALGLLVVVSLWSSRLTGRLRTVRAGASVAAVAVAVTAVVTAVTGTGYGWIAALGTPVTPHNWSLTTTLGRATGALLADAGSGLAPFAMPAWRWLGVGATALLVLAAWRRRTRLGPVYALGLSLAAVAVLGPAIRPWYVLWGLFLIAAAAPYGRVRRWAAALSGILALAVLPSGFAPDGAQLTLAVTGGALAAAALLCVRSATAP